MLETTNPQNVNMFAEERYDRDFVNAVPFHKELHDRIREIAKGRFRAEDHHRVMDLGAGTGLTSIAIRNVLPNAHLELVDFSNLMIESAKRKLGEKNALYINEDYTRIDFAPNAYDIIVSVMGIHHQSDRGKQTIFKKIHSALKDGGLFLFGDHMTYHDDYLSAMNDAKHFHYMVENAQDEEALKDWAYHHIFLNELSPVEDQTRWLQRAGFNVETVLHEMNTALLLCEKLPQE